MMKLRRRKKFHPSVRSVNENHKQPFSFLLLLTLPRTCAFFSPLPFSLPNLHPSNTASCLTWGLGLVCLEPGTLKQPATTAFQQCFTWNWGMWGHQSTCSFQTFSADVMFVRLSLVFYSRAPSSALDGPRLQELQSVFHLRWSVYYQKKIILLFLFLLSRDQGGLKALYKNKTYIFW